ncbi:MAG: serine acetyltransferase [Gammaproteobacteria bacterium]|nr:serine acetyltransferase [Gammaproteobacteria bacterium]MCK5092491.1 serine acetyltransferase [Gammaproteobacteria bacterium]
MIKELAELLVRWSGGFWPLRRRMRKCRFKPLQGFYKILYYLYLKNYGAFIGHTAEFSSEPCFPHGLHGVFIAGGAQFGENCVIFHHVTIGANPMPFSNTVGIPAIGDNCYIGAGATIIGSIRIGDNCRIGANCTVFSNVPDNSIVVSEKPRIIEKDAPLINKYYRWSKNGPVYFDRGKWVLETDKDVIDSLKNSL